MEPNALKVSRIHIRLYLQVSFQEKLKNASQLGVLFSLVFIFRERFYTGVVEHIWVTSIKTMKKMEQILCELAKTTGNI